MYSQQLSLKNSLVLVLLVLFSVDQALSLSCYECASFANGSCSSPNQTHATQCGLEKSTSPLSLSSTFMERILKSTDSFSTMEQFECGKFTGTNTTANNTAMVVRICLIKQLPCEGYEKIMGKFGFASDSCHRCDTELCNSSSNLSIAFWSLCVSLAKIFMLRN